MTCTFDRKLLLNELVWISKFVEKNSTIPILCNVLLESDGRKLTLTATDLEHAGCTEVEIENNDAVVFKTTVPAGNLINSLKSTKVREVSISALQNAPGVLLELGAGTVAINGIDAFSFPAIPWPSTVRYTAFVPPKKTEPKETDTPNEIAKYEAAYAASCKSAEERFVTERDYGHFEITGLPAAIAKVVSAISVSAISVEESRFILNGALFENRGRQSVMVATDGHRLHIAQCRASQPPVCPWNTTRDSRGNSISSPAPVTKVLIPKKALVIAEATYSDDYIHTYVNENHVCFREPDNPRIILSRKLTGNFPDYERVLPKLSEMETVEVNPAALFQCITQVKPFADKRSLAVRLDIEHAEMKVWADTPERGKGSATVQLPTNDVEFHSGYNALYLLDALSEYKKESAVRFSFKDPSNAVQFSSMDGDATYVIMPLRLLVDSPV